MTIRQDNPDNKILFENEHPPGWINPEPDTVYDLAVIGAGPAGLTASTLAADKGARVALIESALLGGECFNVGCIPSKSILRTSRLYTDIRNAKNFGGIVLESLSVDFSTVMGRMERIRAQISGHISFEMLQKKGIDVYFGEAQFSGGQSLTVKSRTLQFRKSIIATGSRPLIPRIPGLDHVDYLTNENIFNLETLPKSLLVIGGGAIGCELAQAFCRLGSTVTIVQTDPMFLNNIERDGAQILSDSMASDGVNIHLNSTILEIRKSGSEKIIDIVNTGNKTTITATDILIGTGQRPNIEMLNLAQTQVQTTPTGHIKIDKYFRTSNPKIYAVGSVCDGQEFNHIPIAMAQAATHNALSGSRQTVSAASIPWCIYTDPEIAHIGLQVLEARQLKIPVKTFTVLMHQIDRAIADSEDVGFVKIHVREGTDKILGATLVSRHAGDIMNIISLAMEAGIGLGALAKIHYPYPTQGDAIRMAAMAYVNTVKPSFFDKLLGYVTKKSG